MITINVSGPAHTGKTTIGAAIAVLLEEHGFDVDVHFLDNETLESVINTDITDRLYQVVEKHKKITVVESQEHRRAMND